MSMPTRSIAASLILSLAASGTFAQAQATGAAGRGGLIDTEAASATVASGHASNLQAERAALVQALVASGLTEDVARARVRLLSNHEVTSLAGRLNEAPAGGVWFAPFLVVAAIIAFLISTRDQTAGGAEASSSGTAGGGTDLFGRPRATN